MGRNPLPDQPPSPQGYPVPDHSPVQTAFEPPPPPGYPNHHDNPLSSVGIQAQDHVDTQAATEQAQPAAYPPQPQATFYQPQQPAAAAYPPQAQPAAYAPPHSPVANGMPCGPQPQAVNYPAGYQPQVTTGTPNWYQPPVTMSVQEWSTGLLECCDDPENAIMTFCFPCVTFGQIAEIVDNGQTSCATSGLMYTLIAAFIGLPCIMSCSYRTKLRSRYNLIETPGPDWAIHLFCDYCALCQEYRELKNRGMDPALGWQGNLSRKQQMDNFAPRTPPINQRMMG